MNQYEKPEVEIVILGRDEDIVAASISVTPPPDWCDCEEEIVVPM